MHLVANLRDSGYQNLVIRLPMTGPVRFVEEEAGDVDLGAVASPITPRLQHAEGGPVVSPLASGAEAREAVGIAAGANGGDAGTWRPSLR